MATRLKIYLEEENIKTLIKNIFRVEFKKQGVNITNIISTNFTLTLKEIKSLEQEVNDLKESLELTQNDLEKIVPVVEKKISTFEIKINEMHDYQIDRDYVNGRLAELQFKISEMKGRSSRNHI